MLLLRKKDSRGIEYLYDHYASSLYGVILRIVREKDLAEEVLQDAFLKIWEKIGLYEEKKGRLFTWMVNLSRNMAVDKVRSKEVKQSAKTDVIGNNVFQYEAERLRPEDIGIRELLEKLPDEQRQVIDWMYFQGYSQSEISEKFGIPLGTIKTRVRAAMNKLRTIFH